jgi:hypothetical protein
MLRKKWRNLIWIVLAAITFTINHFSTAKLARFYYENIYKAIRQIYELSFIHLPFALSYLVLPLLFFLFIYLLYKNFTLGKKYVFLFLIKTVAFIYISFHFLWGFNYNLPKIAQRLDLGAVPIDSMHLITEIRAVQESIVSIRNQLSKDTNALSIQFSWKDLQNDITQNEKPFLKQMGYHYDYDVNIRKLHPYGSLIIFSTTGIYNPYSLEGHVDGGLYHIGYPFTMAHELGHGYGITDEGDCNFIALLTTLHSSDKYVQYSGLFSYYRYLMRDLHAIASHSFEIALSEMPIGLKNDLAMHHQVLNSYPELIPKIRDWIYDFYLRSNGIEDGLASYDRVVALAFAYQSKYGKLRFP